jgi:hypothetical protein
MKCDSDILSDILVLSIYDVINWKQIRNDKNIILYNFRKQITQNKYFVISVFAEKYMNYIDFEKINVNISIVDRRNSNIIKEYNSISFPVIEDLFESIETNYYDKIKI